jgi:hypothetical protein
LGRVILSEGKDPFDLTQNKLREESQYLWNQANAEILRCALNDSTIATR